MDIRFTPGEWKAKGNGVVVSPDAFICRARMMRSGQGLANARLIAAAPNLFKSLHTLLHIPLKEGPELDAAVADAFAALDKAVNG